MRIDIGDVAPANGEDDTGWDNRHQQTGKSEIYQ